MLIFTIKHIFTTLMKRLQTRHPTLIAIQIDNAHTNIWSDTERGSVRLDQALYLFVCLAQVKIKQTI